MIVMIKGKLIVCLIAFRTCHRCLVSTFWDYALSLSIEDVVYLHCHQQEGSGSIVLVGQDGVMQPPIRFPKGGHLLSFLSCLENGLMPYGQLDPPLWSQKGKGML